MGAELANRTRPARAAAARSTRSAAGPIDSTKTGKIKKNTAARLGGVSLLARDTPSRRIEVQASVGATLRPSVRASGLR